MATLADPLNLLAVLKGWKEANPYGYRDDNAEHNAINPSAKGDYALTRDVMRLDPDDVMDFHTDQQFRPMPETIGLKGQMPFPDNHDPRMDFANRWPNLPPSGILNDLKPQPDPVLARKLIVDTLRGNNAR